MNTFKYLIASLIAIYTLNISAAPSAQLLQTAPLILENVSVEMLSPGFWVSRHPSPDELIMTSKQIEAFNASIRSRTGSVSYMPNLSGNIAGTTIRKGIEDGIKLVSSMSLYDQKGQKVQPSDWLAIKANCNLNSIPRTINIRHGFPLRFADQKLAPSEENYNLKAFDYEFNELQNSGYDIGTALVFYHESTDGKWVYGSSATTSGWFRKADICFVDYPSWKEYQNNPDFVVVSSARTDIWENNPHESYRGFARMGARFPLLGETEDSYLIAIPNLDTLGSQIIIGKMAKCDGYKGFLPYTARNVYQLAFKMLYRPYGWADTNGDTDCSSFLKNLFACFGVELPRNSAQQEKALTVLKTFNTNQNAEARVELIIQHGKPGFSLLRLPGHIALYLGNYEDKAYIIHNTWAERKRNKSSSNDLYVIDRVVVSDVSLNHLSTSGSLLKRFTSIRMVK